MKTARISPAALLLLCGGCFSPSVPTASAGADDSGGATEGEMATDAGTSGATDVDPETGSLGTDSTSEESSVGETEQPTETDSNGAGPSVELTVNGSNTPDVIDRASEVVVQVTASDPGGAIESVEILLDGMPLAGELEQVGDTTTARFIVSGADDNGTHLLEGVVTDNDGNVADDTVNFEYDLPNGGLIEAWSFDNGTGGNTLGIHPNEEGDEVVWIGQVFDGADQQMRVDRLVGPAWQENTTPNDDLGADVYPLANGGYVAATSAGDAFDTDTQLRRYSSNGTTVVSDTFDGSDNGESNGPLGIETDSAGDNYVLGVFVGPEQFESYLLKTNEDLTQDWKRSLSGSPETDGMPFVYDFDVRPDGRIVLAGAESSRIWIAILSSDGEVEDQLTLVSEFDQSVAYDVHGHRAEISSSRERRMMAATGVDSYACTMRR
ncbi:MAG: hypothetical protein KUG77_11440 [Nannocystaceae bacterium]|nr:hypothetical protein [Nannocystaceae bacterium]